MIEYRGYFYEIYENGGGYRLYNNANELIVNQPYPYNQLFISGGSDEDNAKAHIDSIVDVPEPLPTMDEQLRSDIDYLSLMLDVPLPSEEEESEEEGE